MTDLTFRHVDDEELDAFWDAMSIPFSFDRDLDDEEHLYELFEKDRLIGAFDGSDVVGTFGGFSFDMAVPGGSLPTAGTTIVTVLPTHRRRGALTGMMHEHIEEILGRREPLAALWASEATIYGRFGYGVAAEEASVEIDARRLRFPSIDDSVVVRFVDAERALEVFPGVFERALGARPGVFRRSLAWWEHRRLRDPARHRGGATAQRLAVAERNGEPVGYVQFRTKEDWSSGHAAGTVRVLELVGTDLEAEKALWRFVASMDLMDTIACEHRPIDDPLIWALEDPRRLNRKVSDSLWIRVLDVPAALGGRRYAGDGVVVLEVRDAFRPELGGRFRLAVEGGVGMCERTDGAADLALDTAYLGALFLGGHSICELAAAGVVEGSPEALEVADPMFRWTPRPFCPEVF